MAMLFKIPTGNKSFKTQTMKITRYLPIIALAIGLTAACEDKDYLPGLPEYDHHYYLAYVPYNNSAVVVNRSQTALVKFPVQFHSAFVRSYDAVGMYTVYTTGIANPAVLGQDFNIVDKNGNILQPVEGKYAMVFPQAKKLRDTIYVKLLNSTVPGTRKLEINLIEHITTQYSVDTMSTAFKRPLEIK